MKTLKRPIVVIDEPPQSSLGFDPRKVVIALVAIFVAGTMLFAGIGGAYVFWGKDKAEAAKKANLLQNGFNQPVQPVQNEGGKLRDVTEEERLRIKSGRLWNAQDQVSDIADAMDPNTNLFTGKRR